MTTQTIVADPAPRPSRWRQIRDYRLWHYVFRYWRRYALGLSLLTVAAFLSLVPPIILRDAIDALNDGTTADRLIRFGALIVGLAIVESAIRFVGRWYVSATARQIEYELRTDLSDQFMALDRGFFLRSRTGDLMARATNDL